MEDNTNFKDANEYEVCCVCDKKKLWSEMYFLEGENEFICIGCYDDLMEEDSIATQFGFLDEPIRVSPETQCEDCGMPCEDGIGYECDHGIVCEACYEEFFVDCSRPAFSAVGEVEDLGGFTYDSFYKGGNYKYTRPKPHCNFCNTTLEDGELITLDILGRKIEGVCTTCASGFTHL